MRNFILVRTSFEGWHCWKGAPIEVDFLKKTLEKLNIARDVE